MSSRNALSIAAAMTLGLAIWACQDNQTPSQPARPESVRSATRSNNQIIMDTRDILDITGGGLQDQSMNTAGYEGGRIAHHRYDWRCRPNITGNFSVDNSHADSTIYHGTISIDFGDGSTCPDSTSVRKGKLTDDFLLTLIHHDSIRTYSLVETITMEGFSRDSTLLDGTFTTQSASGSPTVLTMDGARITYPDGSFTNWDGSLTFTYDNAGTLDTWRDDTRTVTGSVTGSTRDSVSFSAAIVDPVVFDYSCFGRFEVPVSGTVEINTGGVMSTVDYGDGTCDQTYTITTDGVSTEYSFNKDKDKGGDEEENNAG